MGMKQLPKRSGEYLFEIIMRRNQVRSTVMTSNRPLQDWGKLIGDVPSATAILDRFLHNAEIITMNGRSYRLRNRSAGEPGDCAGQTSGISEQAKPTTLPEANAAIPPTGSEPASAAPRRPKTAATKSASTCES